MLVEVGSKPGGVIRALRFSVMLSSIEPRESRRKSVEAVRLEIVVYAVEKVYL